MKPLGTITKYYQFIDEESKSILNSLMEESSSYNDFAQRLCKVVLKNEVPVYVTYLAAVQAWWCRTEESMRLIQEKYKDVPCIRPWGYIHSSSISDQARYHDAVVEAIDNALASSLDDWIQTELHLLHAHFHYPRLGDIPSLLEPLEKAKSLTKANPHLTCFEPPILLYEGLVQSREGNKKDALVTYRRGLELAKSNDDALYMYLIFEPLAADMKNLDIHTSLALYEEMYSLAQDLEVPYMMAEVLYDTSAVFELAGEYDLAISSQNESITIWGGGDTPSMSLSRIYATLGNGPKALEWANQAFEYVGHIEFPMLYFLKAWALALVNKLDEAESHLATAHSLILKTGQETQLGFYYYVSGVIEHTRGNNLAALDFLQQSYEIMDRLMAVLYKNIVLLELARAEISVEPKQTDDTKNITPGRWLSKLEKYATDCDLIGIRMYAALLKSELYQKHGQLKDAHATLLDALNITDSLGVRTLRRKINERVLEMNQLLREEAVSSKRRRE